MRAFKLIITPDPEDLEVAEVFVDGTLDGRPYRFLLDTGTARTCVQFDAYTSTFAAIERRTNAGVFATNREDLISVPLRNAVCLGSPPTNADMHKPLILGKFGKRMGCEVRATVGNKEREIGGEEWG